MKRLIIVLTPLIFLFSCSSSIEKQFNRATAPDDMKTIKSEIDSSDFELLSTSLIQLTLEGKSIEDMTYAEILEEGKKKKAEKEKQKAEAEKRAKKLKQEEQERLERLNKIVTVTCFEKGYVEYDYKKFITYKLAIQNNSEKKIRALKGVMKFLDLFDQELQSLNFVYDERIPAGEKAIFNGTSDYNSYVDNNVIFKNKDLEDLKITWNTEEVIFEDGTTAE